MDTCPLDDFELTFLVGKVAERLQQGESKEQLIEEIAETGWNKAEVTAFVDEVEARARGLGHAPQGVSLLETRAKKQMRYGLLLLIAGVVAGAAGYSMNQAPLPITAGAVLVGVGIARLLRAQRRLAKYRS